MAVRYCSSTGVPAVSYGDSMEREVIGLMEDALLVRINGKVFQDKKGVLIEDYIKDSDSLIGIKDVESIDIDWDSWRERIYRDVVEMYGKKPSNIFMVVVNHKSEGMILRATATTQSMEIISLSYVLDSGEMISSSKNSVI